MKKAMERIFLGGLILLAPVSGFACSMALWVPGQSGAVTVASPPDIARVSELCAMQATDTGHVQDNSPSAHTTFIARFYVRPQLSGSGQADLFVAYDNDTPGNQLVKVSYDGTNLDFHAGDATVLGSKAATQNNWHLVEIKYVSGGSTEFWVDKDATLVAPDGSYASATGGIESVRLGLPNGKGGLTGSATFDSYESRSTTQAGPLKIGDANGDDVWNIFDYGSVQLDAAGTLQMGQPDCNLDGSVNIFDYGCVQLAIANN